MKVIYRLATVRDAEAIAKLEQECFSAHPWSEEELTESLLKYNYRFFVAAEVDENGEETGNIVGYVGMYIVAAEGNITNVAVTTPARRQGVGRGLMNALCEYSKKSDCIALTLEVRVSNAPAKKLYQSLGFEIAGVRKNFYLDPVEDAEIMWLHFAV